MTTGHMNPFHNRAAELIGSDDVVDFRRASGDCVCGCGRIYYKHPVSEHRDFNGEPFLHRLCNGDLVKL